MRAKPVAALSPIIAVAALLACSELKNADEPGEDRDGSSDASGPAEGDANTDAKGDAGPPPDDFECVEWWIKASKSKSECEARRVFQVDSLPAIDANGVSIARTPAGRVGIVYNTATAADSDDMMLAHFVPSTPQFDTPVLVKKTGGFYMHWGHVSKIAASPPDTLHVLAHDVEDLSSSGEVHLYKLEAGNDGGTDFPSDPELVIAGVDRPSELAISVDNAGNTFAAIRVGSASGTAKLSVRQKLAGGSFATLPDVATDLLLPGAPHVGAASLLAESNGPLHLLFHYLGDATTSSPRYHTLDGTAWSFRKTLDQGTAPTTDVCGFDPHVAIFGTTKYALYFFREGGQTTNAVAELRLATWMNKADPPTIEVIEKDIVAGEPLSPSYRAALAVDKYGLVHVAVIFRNFDAVGKLVYKRQTRTTGGATKWLTDIIDPAVLDNASEAFVDMIVDENARPHIAYRSSTDGFVRYATRFDR